MEDKPYLLRWVGTSMGCEGIESSVSRVVSLIRTCDVVSPVVVCVFTDVLGGGVDAIFKSMTPDVGLRKWQL